MYLKKIVIISIIILVFSTVTKILLKNDELSTLEKIIANAPIFMFVVPLLSYLVYVFNSTYLYN
jgi:hypothetical protein